MRDRIRRRGVGSYEVRLKPKEQVLVESLVRQLREQLTQSTDQPHLQRLFPPAYANDAERDAGYQVLTRDEMLEGRLAALDVVERTLDGAHELDQAELTAWMTTLNSLRLVMGTLLDVDEDAHEIDPSDPDEPRYAVYDFLAWILAQAVDAISGDLPPPTTLN
jgi:Domain of unknown function (DUF2017)